MSAPTVAELAAHVSGTVEGEPERRIRDVAAVQDAGAEDLTFVSSPRYASALGVSRPGAVLVDEDFVPPVEGLTLIRVEDPQLAFARLLELIRPRPEPPAGVHPTAVLGRGVRLGDAVSVGPHAVLEEDVELGTGTRIGASVFVARGVRVGRDCRIGAGCTLLGGARLGDRVQLHPGVRIATDGFGYATGPDGAVKLPQVGRCVIGDDVEIGANSTVDRGALGDTVIGRGTKIDNLVHVGHNVEIGERCMIVAQVGLAGSTRVGHGVALGGQAGIAGHLTIGDGARIGARAGVIGDVPSDATYSGYPARPHRVAMRASAALLRLPEALRRLRRLERRLGVREDAMEDEAKAGEGAEPGAEAQAPDADAPSPDVGVSA